MILAVLDTNVFVVAIGWRGASCRKAFWGDHPETGRFSAVPGEERLVRVRLVHNSVAASRQSAAAFPMRGWVPEVLLQK